MIYYIRNTDGELLGLKYNNQLYYYKKNYQQDIIGIYNSSYEEIVKYKYDSWGNIISITDNNNQEITDVTNIGLINPFRYRSYYYDTETNLYYLNSRYYNSEWGRFINADGTICSNKDLISANIYNYCSNNPINGTDIQGESFRSLLRYMFLPPIQRKPSNTESMFLQGTLGNGKKQQYGQNSNLSNALKKSTNMNKEIDSCLSNHIESKKQSSICESNRLQFYDKYKNFSDLDLKYSVGRASSKVRIYNYNLSNSNYKCYKINVNVTDTYDFHYVDNKNVTSLINNAGYFLQEKHFIKKYDWEANYGFIKCIPTNE